MDDIQDEHHTDEIESDKHLVVRRGGKMQFEVGLVMCTCIQLLMYASLCTAEYIYLGRRSDNSNPGPLCSWIKWFVLCSHSQGTCAIILWDNFCRE